MKAKTLYWAMLGLVGANVIVSLVFPMPHYSSVCHLGAALLVSSFLLPRNYWPIHLAVVCALASVLFAAFRVTSWSAYAYTRPFVMGTSAAVLLGSIIRYRTVRLVLKVKERV